MLNYLEHSTKKVKEGSDCEDSASEASKDM